MCSLVGVLRLQSVVDRPGSASADVAAAAAAAQFTDMTHRFVVTETMTMPAVTKVHRRSFIHQITIQRNGFGRRRSRGCDARPTYDVAAMYAALLQRAGARSRGLAMPITRQLHPYATVRINHTIRKYLT